MIDELKDGKVRGVSEEVVAQHGGTVFEWDVDHPANSQEPLCQRLRSTFDPDSVFANEV